MPRYLFVTNYYNHHQAWFAQEMDMQTNHQFNFIETIPLDSERKNMGWGQEKKPTYVLQSYIDDNSRKLCKSLIDDADVVIWGSCPFAMIRPRLRKKKLTFAYSERLFKKGNQGVAFWSRAAKYSFRLALYQKNHYLLCSSAYAAGDYNSIGLFNNAAFKWGYFPKTEKYDVNTLMALKKNKRISLLWAGRFIEWKHPEHPILIAKKLQEAGYDFKLDIIGNGIMKVQMEQLIRENNLQNYVYLLGTMPPEKVREHMERASIFLFTSDQNEGWGAVLNESMNSGCAVIARNEIGAVPFLLKDKENGLIYHTVDELLSQVKSVMDNPEYRTKLGIAAYYTIVDEWNAHVAVERLLQLISSNSKEPKWKTGPVSREQGKRKGLYHEKSLYDFCL